MNTEHIYVDLPAYVTDKLPKTQEVRGLTFQLVDAKALQSVLAQGLYHYGQEIVDSCELTYDLEGTGNHRAVTAIRLMWNQKGDEGLNYMGNSVCFDVLASTVSPVTSFGEQEPVAVYITYRRVLELREAVGFRLTHDADMWAAVDQEPVYEKMKHIASNMLGYGYHMDGSLSEGFKFSRAEDGAPIGDLVWEEVPLSDMVRVYVLDGTDGTLLRASFCGELVLELDAEMVSAYTEIEWLNPADWKGSVLRILDTTFVRLVQAGDYDLLRTAFIEVR